MARMRLIITVPAQRDLAQAYELISVDSPAAAERVLDRLVDLFEQLAAGELKGPEVRLRGGQVAHRWSSPPYRIYYRRTARRTVIMRVHHQARRPIER